MGQHQAYEDLRAFHGINGLAQVGAHAGQFGAGTNVLTLANFVRADLNAADLAFG